MSQLLKTKPMRTKGGSSNDLGAVGVRHKRVQITSPQQVTTRVRQKTGPQGSD